MKKISVYIVLFVVGIGVLFWWGRSAQSTAPVAEQGGEETKSALVLSEEAYEFGTISMKAGEVSRVLMLTNPSASPVVIKQIQTSCMCTNAYLLGESGDREKGPFGMPGHGFSPPANISLASGESKSLEVTFDPAAHGPAGVGVTERAVYIVDDAGGVLTFNFRANVTP